jgi:tetrahydromethanopterin S-methyltransferase subunit C
VSKSAKTKNKENKKAGLNKTAICGLLVSLAGIYIALLVTFPENAGLPPAAPLTFAAGIGMIAAIVWAADSVRSISKYGLGTGVPSVGMFGIGLSTVIAVFAAFLNTIWSPIIGAVLALAIGWISGKLINSVIGMNIPGMEKRIAEITAGSTLAMMASFVVVTGTINPMAAGGYIFTGTVTLGFIGIAVAVFHAYNANLGPDEKPDRTRMLTILDASMLLLIYGIMALLFRLGISTSGGADSGMVGASLQTLIGPAVIIFMSIAFILIAYYKFWTYVKRDAWKIMETGLLPSEEDLN